MKAIILDYTDYTINILPIPKEWEDNADDFVRAHPNYSEDEMYYMISPDDNVEVYDIVQDGEDTDGYPCYDYQIKTTL